MNRKMSFLCIGLLVIISMILTACGSAATPPPPTAAPVATSAPATAVPPTAVPPTATPQPVTLNIWHNYGPDDTKGPIIQSVFKDFMAANPDVTIKDTVLVDADIPMKVETALTANQEPDLVFSVLFDGCLTWADKGVAIPVNDYIKQWGLDGKFTDVALTTYTMADGKISAFPFEGYTWPIWYNTKLFKQAGLDIPTTTDQLIADAKIFRQKGMGGPIIASGSDGMGGALFNLIVQSMMTPDEVNKAFAQGDWTTPGAVAGVNLFTQLRDAGVFVDGVQGVDYASGNTRYFAGNIPMSHFGAWEYTDPANSTVLPDVQLGGSIGNLHGPICWSVTLRAYRAPRPPPVSHVAIALRSGGVSAAICASTWSSCVKTGLGGWNVPCWAHCCSRLASPVRSACVAFNACRSA
jgi:ABC-type glycerol-3-phosphate transport system substrate-binding protein